MTHRAVQANDRAQHKTDAGMAIAAAAAAADGCCMPLRGAVPVVSIYGIVKIFAQMCGFLISFSRSFVRMPRTDRPLISARQVASMGDAALMIIGTR